MKQRKIAWIVMTIAEPFRSEFPQVDGGLATAPGSSWYHLPEDKAHVEFMAEYQRKRGYTVTVSTEVR